MLFSPAGVTPDHSFQKLKSGQCFDGRSCDGFFKVENRSYFDQSELDEPRSFGHLDEEGRLVGVVFDNGVIHVDKNPVKKKVGR